VLSAAHTDAMVTVQQNVAESQATPHIPTGAVREATTSQQCSTESAADEGGAVRSDGFSDIDIQGDQVVREAVAFDDMAPVMEEQHPELSGGEEHSLLAEDESAPPGVPPLTGNDSDVTQTV